MSKVNLQIVNIMSNYAFAIRVCELSYMPYFSSELSICQKSAFFKTTLHALKACAWSGSLHAAWLNTDFHQLCNLGPAPIFFTLDNVWDFFIIPHVWLTLSNCQADKNNPINYFHSYFKVILKEFLNYKFHCLELSLVTKNSISGLIFSGPVWSGRVMRTSKKWLVLPNPVKPISKFRLIWLESFFCRKTRDNWCRKELFFQIINCEINNLF